MDNFNLTKWYRDFYLNESKDQDKLKKLRGAIKKAVREEMGEDFELESRKMEYDIDPESESIDIDALMNDEDDIYYGDHTTDGNPEDTEMPSWMMENKDEEEESEEDSEEESEGEDVSDDIEDDEAALGTISADMEGNEAEIMDNLMNALRAAKLSGNEKLQTQIGNTLKFFVSEYISGGEQ
jgi:hypothetical protein